MKPALPNIIEPVFKLDDKLIQAGLKASRDNTRRRMILPLHRTQEAVVQRMVNFLQPDTYIRPHMHPLDHAVESIVLLKGALTFFVFDNHGYVKEHYNLDKQEKINMIDIEPRIWHNFIVTKPDTVIFESKCGPYDPETDKKFADWSPAEGSVESVDYLRQLKKYI